MRIVSFFSGCGGLDLGFEQAGFDIILANDIEQSVKETYVRNHPHTEFITTDFTNILPADIPDCDGFIGGPPCQSWSIAGKQRGLNDKRGRLFQTYIDMIKVKQPKFFLIENVKGLLDDKFKEIFSDFITQLQSAGYDVFWQLLDAANYSVPQNRERVFIVGFKKELQVSFVFPISSFTEQISLRQAIGDITEEPRKFYKDNIENDNPLRVNHDVFCGEFGWYYNRGNRRRPWNLPSFTITANAENAPLHPSSPKMICFGRENWAFQKDGSYRRLSVRECARIQSFPDSFQFFGNNIRHLYRMIGNAVPPRLGRALAYSIKAALESQVLAVSAQSKSETKKVCTLVGYYKDHKHKELIIKNMLYYVRSDGRPGSLFQKDCEMIPQKLLLYHKDDLGLYNLENEGPVLADASFLKEMGFKVSGTTYLCFRLKNTFPDEVLIKTISSKKFKPFFTTLDKLIVEP